MKGEGAKFPHMSIFTKKTLIKDDATKTTKS